MSERRWGLALIYIVLIVTATLYVQVFGVPFVASR